MVKSISFETLVNRMKTMRIGEYIGIAQNPDSDGSGESWFGIRKIDMAGVDDYSNYWVIQWFGGSDSPSIVTDYDEKYFLNEKYFLMDMRQILTDKELWQLDGTILIDANDLDGEPTIRFSEPREVKPILKSDVLLCGACRYAIHRGVNYCPKCGTKVKKED